MQKLPETHPEIHEQFELGNFSVRRQRGKFNKIPSDQAIEQTINREQKCGVGITGYSTSEGTVRRWVLTSHVAARCQSKMEEYLGMSEANSVTKDVARKRTVFDEANAVRSYELIKDWGTPFRENSRLIHISSGIECDEKIKDDMINAEKKGEEALAGFIRNRIESNEVDLYCPIPKMKLNTFSALKAKRSCTNKDKTVTLKADRDVFARLLVICGKRDVSLRAVLKYSLGPIPWSMATADGAFAKTVKSKLLDAVEKDVADPFVAQLPDNCVRIFDGMVIIQQLSSIHLETFGEMSEYVLNRIINNQAKVIYFVTDQYKENSLKGIERKRRSSGGSIRVQLTRRKQKRPKQFKKYLNDGGNKVDLVKFFLRDWSDPERFKQVIADRVLFFTVESKCYRLEVEENSVTCREEECLFSDQEESDTKLFLCCQHAVQRFPIMEVFVYRP